MAFGNFLNLTGLVSIDFEEGLNQLNVFLDNVSKAVDKIEKSFDGIDTKGFSNRIVDIGLNFGTMLVAFDLAKDGMMSGFAELRKAGGEAFDYIGSRAKNIAQDAIHASSEMETFTRTLNVHLKDTAKTAEVAKRAVDWEITSPWEMSDVQRATRKFVARGISDPDEVMKYVKLASEMASVNDQDIGKAADALMKIRARSPEAYRSLKQNFTIGPDQLKMMGVTLDSGDRLRMRTQGDAQAIIDALQGYYEKTTGMNASAQQAQTIMGKWSSLQSEIWRTSAAFADIIAPKLKVLIDWVRELIKSLNNLSPSTKNIIANFVAGSAAAFALAAALAPIVTIVGGFVAGLGSLAIALTAAIFGFRALSSVIAGLGGLPLILNTIGAGLSSVAARAGVGTTTINSLGAAASVASTRFYTMGAAISSVMTYVAQLSSTPVGVLASKILGDQAMGSAVLSASSASTSGVVVPQMGGFGSSNFSNNQTSPKIKARSSSGRVLLPLAGGAPLVEEMAPIAAGSSTTTMASSILGFGTIATVVGIVIGGFGTYIINAWHDREKLKGDRLEKDSKIEQMALNNKRELSAYLADPTSFSKKRLTSLKESIDAEVSYNTNNADPNEAKLNSLRNDLENEKRRSMSREREMREKGWGSISVGASPAGNTNIGPMPSNVVGAGVLTPATTAPVKTHKEEAEDRQKLLQARIDEIEKYEKKHAEMTEKIINDEKKLSREERLGLVTKQESVERWVALKERSIKAGMSEDDVAKVSEKANAAQIASLHQEMYSKIGAYRQMDEANHSLSLEKKRSYLQQEIALIDKTSMSYSEYAENKKKLNTDAKAEGLRKFIDIYSREGNSAAADWTRLVLQQTLAAPLKGKARVRTSEQEQERSAKVIESDISIDRDLKLRNDKYAAEDLANTGNILGSKKKLARDHAEELLKLVEKGSKQEEQIRRNLHVILKNLYIEDKIAFMQIAEEKAQFLRDISKQQTTRQTSLFQFEESRGARDYEKQDRLREKARTEAIADIEKSSKYKLSKIDEELREENLSKAKRKELELQKLEIVKSSAEKIKDINQASEITKQQQKDVRTKEDLEAQYGTASNKSATLEYREKLLSQRMSAAKSVDKVDQVGKTMEKNLKDHYETQLNMINLKEKEDSLNKTDAQINVIKKNAELERLNLQEKFLQKMQDVTAEMEKQKALLDKGKQSGFTMGGIYNSYEEIVKHDMETSTKFQSQYEDSTAASTDPDAARARAAGKLGIPAGSVSKEVLIEKTRPSLDMGNMGVGLDARTHDRIPLRGSAGYNAATSARALDAWGTFPVTPPGALNYSARANFGSGGEAGGQIIVPVTVNIGDKTYNQTQTQKLTGSQMQNPMNYKHPKGGL